MSFLSPIVFCALLHERSFKEYIVNQNYHLPLLLLWRIKNMSHAFWERRYIFENIKLISDFIRINRTLMQMLINLLQSFLCKCSLVNLCACLHCAIFVCILKFIKRNITFMIVTKFKYTRYYSRHRKTHLFNAIIHCIRGNIFKVSY